MLAIFVGNHLHFNSLIISTCYTIPTINHILALNADELSKNCLPFKIMKEFIPVNAHLRAKHVVNHSDNESHTWCIGNAHMLFWGGVPPVPINDVSQKHIWGHAQTMWTAMGGGGFMKCPLY